MYIKFYNFIEPKWLDDLLLEYFPIPSTDECLKLMLMHDFRLSPIITIRNMKITET